MTALGAPDFLYQNVLNTSVLHITTSEIENSPVGRNLA